MAARCEQFAGRADGQAGTDRNAVSQPLGHGDQVRLQSVGDRGEPLAATTDAGLHLVHPQQRAMLTGHRTNLGQVAVRRHDHPALALDGFQDDRRSAVVHRCRQGLGIAEGHEGDISGERLEGFAVLGGRGERQ